ncbi:hypothetical protein BGZ73_003948 [Actinomortierella ambigua]|nr:hypothetical protein BGZ73_003948 [Actinomortierella ambigua]
MDSPPRRPVIPVTKASHWSPRPKTDVNGYNNGETYGQHDPTDHSTTGSITSSASVNSMKKYNPNSEPVSSRKKNNRSLHPHFHEKPTQRNVNSALTTSICSTIEPSDCTSFNNLTKVIHRHYSRAEYPRSPEQLEREKYLIGKIPFNRWLFLPAAFAFQAVCGTLYAWSVFNNLIDNAIYDNDHSDSPTHMAAITFYIALGCFGVSASIMGPWLERHGPRSAGFLGAMLFLTGNLITAVGCQVKQISLVYIGYGIFGGLGLGISYISPVSALQKWFPDRRGVAAGLAVSGFGAGSIVMAKVPDPLAAAVGLPLTFVILGCFYFMVMVLCAFVFRVPPPGYVVNGLDVWAMPVQQEDTGDMYEGSEANDEDWSTSVPSSGQRALSEKEREAMGSKSPGGKAERRRSMSNPLKLQGNGNRRSLVGHGYDPSTTMNLMDSLYSREYRLMYLMFLGNTMAGVVIISRLANIAVDIFGQSKDTASTIVSINGGFNLIGRLLFASVSDRIGRKNSYMIMLTSQAIILASLPVVMAHKVNWAFLTTIWVLTACYGGGFGCIPAFLCDMFGPCNIGALHGIILTSWSLSSVGAGLLFTAVYNHLLDDQGYTVHNPYIYAVNLYWILGCVCIGLVVTVFVRTGVRDRLLPNLPGEWFHVRIFGRILRVGRFGRQWMTHAEEDEEWSRYLAERELDMSERGGGEHDRNSRSRNSSSGGSRDSKTAKTMMDRKQHPPPPQKQELPEEPYHHYHHHHHHEEQHHAADFAPAASADFYNSAPTVVTSLPLELSADGGGKGGDGSRASRDAPAR